MLLFFPANLTLTGSSNIKVLPEEVKDAIRDLDCNNRCGLDGIYAKHLKYCSEQILPLLSVFFTGMFIHGILPSAMISVIL